MLKMVLAALAATMLCAAVDAAPLLFTLTGRDTATFTLDSNPSPDKLSPNYIYFAGITGAYAFPGSSPATSANMAFFTTSDFGGLSIGAIGGGTISLFGPQVFSGPTSTPMFAPGTFDLSGSVNGPAVDRLVISGLAIAPEPASWAMMITGFGAIGAAMRRRRTAVSFA